MNDRLLSSALVHSLYPERSMEEGAAALARQAAHRADALDRALAHLLRRVRERPTRVTERAAEMLRLARSLSGGAGPGPPGGGGVESRAAANHAGDVSLGAPA